MILFYDEQSLHGRRAIVITRPQLFSKVRLLTSSIFIVSMSQAGFASYEGGSQSESVVLDPMTRNYILSNDGHEAEFSEKGISKESSQTVGFDAVTSENADVYAIPLSYGMPIGLLGGEEFINFSADLPYVNLEGPLGNENGLGDIRVGSEYFVEKEGIIFKGSFDVKLPTGDEEVGLGSGSTDLGFAVSGRQRIDNIGFNATAGYIIRGEGEVLGADIDYGNVINLVGGGEYQVKPAFWVGANLALVRIGTSDSSGFETDGLQTIDLIPNASYRINTDMTVMLDIIYPLSESVVDGDAPGDAPDRELSMSFGITSEF